MTDIAKKPIAWVTPLRWGSQVTFYKPPPSTDDEVEWFCRPLWSTEQAQAIAAQDMLDAARYRVWRDALAAKDISFMERIHALLVKPGTADDWDAALDAERGAA